MRPTTEQFGVDDRPPFGVTFFTAIQHLAAIAPPGLVLPVLVARHARADQATMNAMLAGSMLALGIASLLQCGRWRGGLGSGFLAPAIFTAAYLPPCFHAAERGGLPLVAGMMIFAGACEVLLSRVLGRLRPWLPTEIAGLAVTMIGVVLGILGFRLMFGLPETSAGAGPAMTVGTVIGLCSLAGIFFVNIWGPRPLRIYAVLIVLVVAWAAAAWLGEIDPEALREGFRHGVLGLPRPPLALPQFDAGLAFEFAVTALASSLRTVGDLTTCQKINDPGWQRPDMVSLKRGLLADGLGNMIAGGLGTMGLSPFSGSIGISVATGVKARRVGLAVGIIFIVLAFFPGAIALSTSIPMPVSGAILLFSSCFILINGLQIILSRLLDNRKVLVVGLGLIFGLSRDIFPDFFNHLPLLAPLAASSLAEALLVAILLNFFFRIGTRMRAQLTLAPGDGAVDRVHAFCQAQGGAWAARRDVMQRVTLALAEFAETAGEVVEPGREAEIELAFDEFHIDATIRYAGRALEKADAGPGAAGPDLADGGELPADLSLRIIGRMADRFTSGRQGGMQWLKLGFEH
ncbi:xanthine/uracil permease [Opitutaceae bacterium TAV1]|nr:xanthine/uracil permease [Opitutaceae bacterium TAV1]